MKTIFIYTLFIQAFFKPELNRDLYIKFEYTGDSDKPIPEMILFVNKYELSKSTFTNTFRINKTEFDSLKFLIETAHKLFNKTEVRYYRFTIYDGDSMEYFFVKDKIDLSKAFGEINYRLRYSNQKNKIKDQVTYILNRIG